ncbi:MAG: FAD-dependent oxidoreductase [Pseudomonadota bacterium]
MTTIAIIGAGLAGTTLANSLSDRAAVRVFEKSRGIGGRMATRYAGIFEFDHGAQYFSVRTEAFRQSLQPLIANGIVSEWNGKVVSLSANNGATQIERSDPIYVASPRMNALPKHLADGLDVNVRCEIANVVPSNNGQWQLVDSEGGTHGPFDWVVSAAPSVQTSRLLPESISFAGHLASVQMAGCFSVLLGFDERPDVDWEGAKVTDSPIGWIAVNSEKPGRKSSPSVIVQTTNAWAEENLERDPDEVSQIIMDELKQLTGIDVGNAKHNSRHRWRYAHTPVPAGNDCLIDKGARLAACGDWCIGGRVEHAFTSAKALAAQLPV